jgi:hypothetical protein
MKNTFKKSLLSIIFIFMLSYFSFGHSGRTDSSGGHYNRKTGEYHYHNSGKNNDDSKAVIGLILFGILIIGAIIYNIEDNDKKN